jgi:rubrerythrin
MVKRWIAGGNVMYYNYYYRAPLDEELVASIANAINGEFTALACYEILAKVAPTEKARERIHEIRKDESRHFNTFTQIYTSLTGKPPVPKIIAKCPSEYAPGLHFAFEDEQNTVDVYRRIAQQAAATPWIRDPFNAAAADEQHHAVWFLYFLTRHR